MEIKATLQKPYTEEERMNFIVEYNHGMGYVIEETETELQALGYTDEEIAEQDVYMIRADGKANSKCDYRYNYTTSMFYISLSTTSVNNKAYCTFAQLQEDSQATLEDLQEALTEYIESNYNGEVDNFTEVESVVIGEDDPYLASQLITATFSVPKSPIVIKSVKVTKY